MKTISERVWNMSQSWHYEKVVRLAESGETFRCRIERNAYDGQSSARVERWSGEEWREVVRTPINFLNCRTISYVQEGITSSHFRTDFKRLMDEALEITAPKPA